MDKINRLHAFISCWREVPQDSVWLVLMAMQALNAMIDLRAPIAEANLLFLLSGMCGA